MLNLSKKYPNFVQVKRIGRSHEKRPIMSLRVCKRIAYSLLFSIFSKHKQNYKWSNLINKLKKKMTHKPKAKISKQLFLFDGGIHAREWLSVATIVVLIDQVGA